VQTNKSQTTSVLGTYADDLELLARKLHQLIQDVFCLNTKVDEETERKKEERKRMHANALMRAKHFN
jgi:hypothetical protein